MNFEDPPVRAWLQGQKELANDSLSRGSDEWAAISDYVLTLPLHETDYFALTVHEQNCYFLTQEPGEEKLSLHCVAVDGGDRQRLLDPATDLPEVDLRLQECCLEVSPCGAYLALVVSERGEDAVDLMVFDLIQRCFTGDRIRRLIDVGVAWLPDSSGFYYSVFRSLLGASEQGDGLYCHRLGTPVSEDRCVIELTDVEQQKLTSLSPVAIPNTSALLLRHYSYIDATASLDLLEMDVSGSPIRLLDKQASVHLAGFDGGDAYVTVDRGDGNTHVLAIDISSPSNALREVELDALLPVASPFPAFRSNRCVVVDGQLLLVCLRHASHVIYRYLLDGKPQGELAISQPGTVIGMCGTSEGDVLMQYTSFLQPLSLYRCAMNQAVNWLPLCEFSCHFGPDVEVRQIFCETADGMRIPVFLVGRKLQDKGTPRPLLLYGYGGFGQSITPVFNPDLPCWLKMDGVYALANIRGGGEYGQDWHRAATGKQRTVAFEDFAAVARVLAREGYTDREHLAIRGISNGGLLVGATIVLNPDVCAAAIAEAALLDMFDMLNSNGADVLCNEYGDIRNDKEALDLVSTYSPVQNVRAGVGYPAVLVVPGGEDERAAPWQSAKFIAALQSVAEPDSKFLLSIVDGEGHVNWLAHNMAANMADQMCFLRRNIAGLSSFSETDL